jgi:hypothetical protein
MNNVFIEIQQNQHGKLMNANQLRAHLGGLETLGTPPRRKIHEE